MVILDIDMGYVVTLGQPAPPCLDGHLQGRRGCGVRGLDLIADLNVVPQVEIDSKKCKRFIIRQVQVLTETRRGQARATGARARAWFLLMHAEASLSLSLSSSSYQAGVNLHLPTLTPA